MKVTSQTRRERNQVEDTITFTHCYEQWFILRKANVPKEGVTNEHLIPWGIKIYIGADSLLPADMFTAQE